MVDRTAPLLIVDAANVVGSRPDGWWRDRPGAARRLVERITVGAGRARIPTPVVVVLEGAARPGVRAGLYWPERPGGSDRDDGPGRDDGPDRDDPGVEVVHAPASGDDEIVARVAGAVAAGRSVVVVTADRGLAGRVRAHSAEVVGPGWLLARLDGPTP